MKVIYHHFRNAWVFLMLSSILYKGIPFTFNFAVLFSLFFILLVFFFHIGLLISFHGKIFFTLIYQSSHIYHIFKFHFLLDQVLMLLYLCKHSSLLNIVAYFDCISFPTACLCLLLPAPTFPVVFFVCTL